MAKTVKEQIVNAFTWAKAHLVRKVDVVNSTAGTATNLPASAAAVKKVQDEVNTLNTNLASKATLNSEVTFAGIHIGSSIPYIYCSDDGKNILFRISNGSDYVYPSVLGFINDINSLKSAKQNALSQGLLPDGANLNDYLATNVYTLSGTSYKNNPANYGVLVCFDPGYAYKAQIVFSSSSNLYYRFRSDNGLWTAWHVVNSSEVK